MERKKYLLLIIALALSTLSLGQTSNAIYDAYRESDMNAWKGIIDDMEKIPGESDPFFLQLINYQYGYIAWCIGTDKKEEAEKYLDLAKRHLDTLEKGGYSPADVYAYRAAFTGYEIAISPYKAPFLGPESLQYARQAINADPSNPAGYVQFGNIMNYMPRMFGGSKKKALYYYYKALEIMERNGDEQDWNYLNLLGSIIKAHIETRNYVDAEKYCIKSLEIEPGFGWVKNDLYPSTLKYLKQ